MRNLQARGRVMLLGVAAFLFTAASAHAVATLTVSDAELAPGETVQVTVSLNDGGDPIAGTENDIGFPEGLTVGNCAVNPAINKGGTSFTEGNPFKALVLALNNVDPIPDGSVMYTCDVTAAGDAADGEYTIDCDAPGASDPDGNEIEAECVDGTVTVVGPPAGAIIIGDAAGLPGSTVSIEIELDVAEGETIVGTENIITFAPGGTVAAEIQGQAAGGVQIVRCEVNPEIDKDATSFAFQPAGCAQGVDCSSLKALVLALNNVDPIADGSVMYTCLGLISEDAVEGETYPLTCSEQGASDAEGNELRIDCIDGEILVLGVPSPTPTNTPEDPTPTPDVDTPTPTPGEPTDTPTTRPTNTPAFSFDDDSCAIVAPETSTGGWTLLLPLAGLLWLRRRSK